MPLKPHVLLAYRRGGQAQWQGSGIHSRSHSR